jgi:hypothetical protein
MSVYAVAKATFVPMLRNLSNILDKAAKHAADKKFDPAVLVNARLAPNMYHLGKQVQVASDQAKGLVARAMGQEPPKFEDNEQTIDELKARIAKTIAYIESATETAFKGAEERDIVLPFGPTMALEMKGARFLCEWSLPNFYFHMVTAYDILRHNGVEIGKGDFLGDLSASIKQK